jgi:DNA-binding NarL/FixJ family response regulator
MNLNVILIEDDPISLYLYERVLKGMELGGDVLSFSSVDDALKYFDANYSAENRYVVILEIHTLLKNGWEFLDAIESKSDSMWVVIISSRVEKEERERAAKYKSVAGIFQKPIPQDCIATIKELCLRANDSLN